MGDIYQAPEAELIDDSVEREPVYGGFWLRFIASFIDSIWVMALTFTLGWMVYGAIYFESTDIIQGGADFFISYVLPFVLTMAFWFYWAATPGKMLLGLKIVDANSLDKASKGRLVLRYFAYYVSLIPLGLGFFWVAWDKRKQGWHDKIARTLVVKDKEPGSCVTTPRIFSQSRLNPPPLPRSTSLSQQ
ncbi:MAG: RDD family protein [Gammaproteobacteria bacterium]|nr:RDD family protein [Gammaproteobacteria bacterium]